MTRVRAAAFLAFFVAGHSVYAQIATALPPERIGHPYSVTLHITGTDASIVEGKVPDGLTLSANGVLSGTPTAAGVYTFVVGKTAYTLRITEPAR